MAGRVDNDKNKDETQAVCSASRAHLFAAWRTLQVLGDDEWEDVKDDLGEDIIAALDELFGPDDPTDYTVEE
jgi:hypothetical protein